VVTGAAPAEYGDKTSLVINAITRSGLNQTKPTGSFNALYGTFGTTHEDGSLAYGNVKGGNFVAFNFERSGRFLDAPEFTVLHDRGTAMNLFDRIDYSPNSKDTFHLNLFLARNRFQTPNEFDQHAWARSTTAGQFHQYRSWLRSYFQSNHCLVDQSVLQA
jgi:hypothetical protein